MTIQISEHGFLEPSIFPFIAVVIALVLFISVIVLIVYLLRKWSRGYRY